VGTFDTSEGILKLDVVVTDNAGKPVAGLTPKDFTLLDNGQPLKIVTLHAFDGITAKPDPQVETILVIDTVNLQPKQVNRAQEEILKFLHQNGGRLAQPALIYLVSRWQLMVTPQPSTDGNLLAEQITHTNELRAISPPEQGLIVDSAVFPQAEIPRNPISLTALGAMALEERQRPGRKLLIWVGFGWPARQGGVTDFDYITEFSTRMREARVELSSINLWPIPALWFFPDTHFKYQDYLAGVKSSKAIGPKSLALQVVGTQSGGRVVSTAGDLAGEIDKLIAEEDAFYTISFDPPRAEEVDEYHDLKVELGKPNLAARTNTGYYDEPTFYDQPQRTIRKVTVEALEQLLRAPHEESESAMAEELSGVELTERMSWTELSEWKVRMPGAKSRAELVAVADASTFLDPPAAKVPDIAAPDLAMQRQMMSKTLDYLAKTIPRLPNFFAARGTVRYRETGQKDDAIWKVATGDQRQHSEAISIATVLYRNGLDLVDAPAKEKKPKKADRMMDTKGTFGPILSTVILDASQGDLRWSRWEQGAGGVQAVFRYAVPKTKSHYGLSYCCLTDGDGTKLLKLMPGYHGELMIDPESGAILRLTVEADLEPRLPLELSDIMVQYGPETIGGNSYICPVRSVSLWRGQRNVRVNEWGGSFKVYGPFETMLDDVSFGNYHMFRGEARILTGYDAAPDGKEGESGTSGAPGRVPRE
jgi:VWFA-related protein